MIKHEEFFQLPLPHLIDIISSDVLDVTSEEQVYKAVMSWIRHNMEERKSHLLLVLQHVRIHLLTPNVLEKVRSDDLIKSDEACGQLVIQAMNYVLLAQGERSQMPGKRLKMGEVLMLVGGRFSGGECSKSVIRYDPQTRNCKMRSPMSTKRQIHGVGVLNNLLYAVGGYDGKRIINSAESYDPHTNLWSSDVAPMSVGRCGVGVAAMDGFLYAAGGWNRDVRTLKLVEKYDPEKNTWTEVASMNTGRKYHAVVALNNFLYAIGGSNDHDLFSASVERYDPRENKWTEVASMSRGRAHLGGSVFRNKICVAGGFEGHEWLKSGEVYNPNIDVWSPIGDMKYERCGVSLAVVRGKLLAVGGDEKDGSTIVNTIEMYDEMANSWELGGSMDNPREDGGVGVVSV